MSEREDYNAYVRANREAYLRARAATKPPLLKRLGQAIARHLRPPVALVKPERPVRTSGPRLVMNDPGLGEWHTPAFQAVLCEACHLTVLPATGRLKDGRFCGPCSVRGAPNVSPPLRSEDDDHTPHAA